MAEDHGSPTRNSTTTLRISVRDLNDNQPVIKGGAWIRVNITEVILFVAAKFISHKVANTHDEMITLYRAKGSHYPILVTVKELCTELTSTHFVNKE